MAGGGWGRLGWEEFIPRGIYFLIKCHKCHSFWLLLGETCCCSSGWSDAWQVRDQHSIPVPGQSPLVGNMAPGGSLAGLGLQLVQRNPSAPCLPAPWPSPSKTSLCLDSCHGSTQSPLLPVNPHLSPCPSRPPPSPQSTHTPLPLCLSHLRLRTIIPLQSLIFSIPWMSAGSCEGKGDYPSCCSWGSHASAGKRASLAQGHAVNGRGRSLDPASLGSVPACPPASTCRIPHAALGTELPVPESGQLSQRTAHASAL